MKTSFLLTAILLSLALTQCNSGGDDSSPSERDPSNASNFKGGLKIENIKSITFLDNGNTVEIQPKSNTTTVTITEGTGGSASQTTYTSAEAIKVEKETKNPNGYFTYELTIPDTSTTGNITCKFNPSAIQVTLMTQASSPVGGYDIIGETTSATTINYATNKTITLATKHAISVNTTK